jgi:3',5'-cyclic-AMP phosphodiesterase
VQLTWSAMGPARCVVGVGDRARIVTATPPAWIHRAGRRSQRLSRLPGGPGAAVIDGLEPSTTYEVWVAAARGPDPTSADRCPVEQVTTMGPRRDDRWSVAQVTTLRPPPGRLLARFASVSDLHVGESRFGAFGRIREGPELGKASALLCLEAALREAKAWGAELIVSRGDMTQSSRADQFVLAARTLAGAGLPALGVLGNHDVRRRTDGVAACRAQGLAVSRQVVAHDLPGLRLVLAHSPMADEHRGDLPDERITRIAELCRAGPTAVILHHPLTSRRLLSPYPPGVPVDQSARLTAALRAANPATVVLAGHRHRNRRQQVGGITVAELGSTKDFPGSWAGYAVYEGGIRQVVRRVADPAALAWTEATGRALAGQWARWAPGRLEDRCWVLAW